MKFTAIAFCLLSTTIGSLMHAAPKQVVKNLCNKQVYTNSKRNYYYDYFRNNEHQDHSRYIDSATHEGKNLVAQIMNMNHKLERTYPAMLPLNEAAPYYEKNRKSYPLQINFKKELNFGKPDSIKIQQENLIENSLHNSMGRWSIAASTFYGATLASAFLFLKSGEIGGAAAILGFLSSGYVANSKKNEYKGLVKEMSTIKENLNTFLATHNKN